MFGVLLACDTGWLAVEGSFIFSTNLSAIAFPSPMIVTRKKPVTLTDEPLMVFLETSRFIVQAGRHASGPIM